MSILTVAYGHPTDPAAFDAHYEQVHRGLVAQIPGVTAFSARRCASLDGSTPPYYLLAQLTFDSEESLGAGLGSPEGNAAAGDVGTFATGGATMFVQQD